MIKPDFFSDGKIASCSPLSRLLFIGSWVFADDAGNLDRDAIQLKCQIFPADNFDIEPLIHELIGRGLLLEYEASDGTKYLHIKNFLKHQKIKYPTKSARPTYECGTQLPQRSPNPPPAFPQSSPNPPLYVDIGVDDGVGVDKDIRASNEPPAPNGAGDNDRLPLIPKQPDQVQEAVAAWNAMAVRAGLSQVQRITPKRRTALKARLRDAGGIAGWNAVLKKVEESDFLCGEKGWKADFDFVTRQEKFTKIMEGGYPNGRHARQHQRARDDAEIDRIILESTGLAQRMENNGSSTAVSSDDSNAIDRGEPHNESAESKSGSGGAETDCEFFGDVWAAPERKPREHH